MIMNYLVVLLDNLSVAFCHANNPCRTSKLMSIEVLEKTIKFGMKENLMIHFVLPPYTLPQQYYSLMNEIDHVKIGPHRSGIETDVCVYESIPQNIDCKNVVIRMSILSFLLNPFPLLSLMSKVNRITLNFSDIHKFHDTMINEYENILGFLNGELIKLRKSGKNISVNILSDRAELSEMNNCNAGISNITISPTGEFYICPAFYYDRLNKIGYHSEPIGDLNNGIDIKNSYLFSIKNSPICRICNAFHCKRCVWLNSRLTNEINTPSHQQCVITNTEHNFICDSYQENDWKNKIIHNNLIKNHFLDPFERLLNS